MVSVRRERRDRPAFLQAGAGPCWPGQVCQIRPSLSQISLFQKFGASESVRRA